MRGLDEVQLNLVGGGPSGIELPQLNPERPNLLALRGDLRLLSLNSANTQLTYHSAWVETDGQPYLTLIAAPTFVKHFPNPLLKIAP
ncbi:MAG: hypothetical protein HC890_05035 [Chloroflexaceae bacterium]|nr:hypothetical protein [Chloroflexaceae bacterium]